ncbi:hypothetical protein HDU87_002346, partial [Geranomyces variabilis]
TIRTRSTAVPTMETAEEENPVGREDRGRTAWPAGDVAAIRLSGNPGSIAEYLERKLEAQERVFLDAQSRMMEKMVEMMKQMTLQTQGMPGATDKKDSAAAVEAAEVPSRPDSPQSEASLSLNTVAKELLRDVPKFAGDTNNPQLLAEFIAKMDDFLEVAYLPPLLETKMATSKLTSTAHIWWMTLELTMQVPEASKSELEHRYLKGLKRPVYSAIISRSLTDLNEMQEAATRQEQLTSDRGGKRTTELEV